MKALIKPIFVRLRAPWLSKKGQTLVEYALVMAVLSLVAVSIYGVLNTQIGLVFSKIANILDTAQSSH